MNEANYILNAEQLDRVSLAQQLLIHAEALLRDESDFIANCANLSSLVYHSLPQLNWCGFYFLRGNELVLGPFAGKPACTRIRLDRGVCGAAATQRSIQCVDDVHSFPGHIACDPSSRSELVIPIIVETQFVGVFDLDAPILARFDDADIELCSSLLNLLLRFSSSESRSRLHT